VILCLECFMSIFVKMVVSLFCYEGVLEFITK
jgi:hypothetical protein